MDSNYILTPNGNFISEDELYHWGIKGMKWGVRRYQNPDGTLTAAGKKRRKENVSYDVKTMSTDELRQKVNRLNNEKRYMDLSKSSSSAISKTAGRMNLATKAAGDMNKIYKLSKGDNNPYSKVAGQGIDIVDRSSRLAKKIDTAISSNRNSKNALKKLEDMSDSDLVKTVERMDLERQYSELKNSNIRKGKVRIDDILDIAGDVVGIAASSVAIAVGIKKLMNK